MVTRVDWKRHSWILFMLSGACVIFIYYAKYALCINTVWELPDEYGYLINGAYLSGVEWSSFSNLYYGWGYSVLLLPFFVLGTKGTSLIRGAIIVNALCTVVAYWIQIGLMTKLFKNLSKYVIVLIALVLSFYPYIMASNTKVLAESLLNLMTWLCALLAYKALETKRIRWYVLLAICMAYMFFVHTRSFVFIGTWMVIMVAMSVCKMVRWKHLAIFLMVFILCYSGGYTIKDMLIEDVYSNVYSSAHVGEEMNTAKVQDIAEAATEVVAKGTVEEVVEVSAVVSTEAPVAELIDMKTDSTKENTKEAAEVKNLLGIETIINRIKKIFTGDISIYLYSLVCKYFYLAVATLGTYQLGIYAVMKSLIDRWKKREPLSSVEWLNAYLALASLMMICATTVNSPGSLNQVAFFFYGRYYEYLILPIVYIGVVYYINTKIHWKGHLIHFAAIAASGVATVSLQGMLKTRDVSIDIFRMASFSGFAGDGTDYRVMIVNYLVLTVIGIILGAVLNYKEFLRWGFLLVVLAGFAFNNKEISDLVIDISKESLHDNVIVEYVLDHVEGDKVYYLDGKYVSYTTRMQALLGKKQLMVIEIDELDNMNGQYLLVQTSSRYAEQLSEFEKVLPGYYYDLYYIP